MAILLSDAGADQAAAADGRDLPTLYEEQEGRMGGFLSGSPSALLSRVHPNLS
jgi:hypothetical protein